LFIRNYYQLVLLFPPHWFNKYLMKNYNSYTFGTIGTVEVSTKYRGFHALLYNAVFLVIGVSAFFFFPLIKLFLNKKTILNTDGLEWRRLDPIYDTELLDTFRSNAHIYVHGHSVGGAKSNFRQILLL
jgi:hypothetical protein